jgi:M6 family metalloprotease-like protein
MLRYITILLILFILVIIDVFANYRDTGYRKLKQPNGVEFVGRTYGDEFESKSVTSTGYVYVQNYSDGWAYYAVLDAEGDYTASKARVDIDTPPAPPNLERSVVCKAKIQKRKNFNASLTAADAVQLSPPNNPNIGVILVEFSNVKHDTTDRCPDGYYISDFWNLIFSVGIYKTYGVPNPMSSPGGLPVFGSVQDYYKEMSVNVVSFSGGIINRENREYPDQPIWIKVDYTKDECSRMVYNNGDDFNAKWPGIAVVAAEAQIPNFNRSQFDIIIVLYARETLYRGALWPAAIGGKYYSIGEMDENGLFSTIGTHCHELGHALFSFHDQYDDAGATEKTQPGYESYWFHGIMANGSINGPYGHPGSAPAPVEPIFRVRHRWGNVVTIPHGQSLRVTNMVDNDNSPTFYRIMTQFLGSDSNEVSRYYIIENRQRTSPYDKYSTDDEEGILVWQKFSPSVEIDLIEADDNWDNLNNYFPGTTNTKVFIGDGGGGFYIRGKYGVPGNYTYDIELYGDGYNWNNTIADKAMLSGAITVSNLTFNNDVYLMAETHLKSNTGGLFSVINGGHLRSNGTSQYRVTFEGNNSTWSGMFFSGSNVSGSILNYLHVKDVLTYGGAAITVVSCSGITLQNSEIDNNTNYGTSGVSFIDAGEPNIHHNNIHNNGGYGIKYQNTSGNIWANTITDNSYGSVYVYNYSSPRFYYPGFPAYLGNNTLTGGYFNVYANYCSNPFIGSQLDTYYYGSNTMLNTSYYRIAAFNYCDILAENNWWGTAYPSAGWFYADASSSISYLPCLTHPPGSYSPPPEQFVAQVSTTRMKLREVKLKTISEDYPAAANLLKSILSEEIEDQDMQYALNDIVDLYRQSRLQDLPSFMENGVHPNTKHTNAYKAALAHLYSAASKKELSRGLWKELISDNPKNGIRNHAFLTYYYDKFINAVLTEEEKQEIEERSTSDQDVREARWLTSTFYSNLLPQNNSQLSLGKGLPRANSSKSSGWSKYKTGDSYFRWITFSDSVTGYAVSDSLYKTTDRGKSWFGFSRKFDLGYSFFKITSSKWIAALRGVGYTITTNCGISWNDHFSGQSKYPVSSLYFLDEQIGWMIQGIYIFKITNFGESWSIADSGADGGIVLFSSERNGYAMGIGIQVRSTKDGGLTWQTQNLNTGGGNIYGGCVIDTANIIAVGSNGIIIRTTDAGNNWIVQAGPVNQHYSSIYFVNKDIGWIVGWGGTILKTTDRGVTWVQQASGVGVNLYSVFFQDSKQGWVVGDSGTILSTITGGEVTDVSIEEQIPKYYALSQNYPNPFNPTTTINYALPSRQRVKLNIYNNLGQLVHTVVNELQNAGVYSVRWNGTDYRGQKVASGIYFYRLEAGGFVETRKMLILK